MRVSVTKCVGQRFVFVEACWQLEECGGMLATGRVSRTSEIQGSLEHERKET